jgi:hypothetical protein
VPCPSSSSEASDGDYCLAVVADAAIAGQFLSNHIAARSLVSRRKQLCHGRARDPLAAGSMRGREEYDEVMQAAASSIRGPKKNAIRELPPSGGLPARRVHGGAPSPAQFGERPRTAGLLHNK